MIGTDNNPYIPIGDVDGSDKGEAFETKAQHYVNGTEPDGRGGILRISQDGRPIESSSNGAGGSGHGILDNSSPLTLNYAYGIPNSLGIGFDCVTGNSSVIENDQCAWR